MMKKWLYGLFLIVAICFFGCKGAVSQDSPAPAPSVTDVSYPAFEPIGGFYKENQEVSISCEGATKIFYKILTAEQVLHGENIAPPSEDDTLYEGPFTVSEQCIVRAMAVKADGSKNYAMTCFDFDKDRSTDFSGTQLPSPNWQEQIIYFILTDRFYDGDPSNNKIAGLTNQRGEPYDESIVLPGQPASSYNGGDLAGIEQKLDYIKNLGCTAIWITPPIKNQVADANYHGFHGYWASDFTKVDEHMGTLAEYQSLVNAAHSKGLYVIQDIVVNHTGDYQEIMSSISATDVKNGVDESQFRLKPASVPYCRPEQLPWGFNNVNWYTPDEFKNNAFYNFNPGIADYTDLTKRYTWATSDLDDMNTKNPVVENLLRGYFRYWIDKAGIDGYRIDTVYYVEEDFFKGFINSEEAGNEGIRPYARKFGKNDFINFGEAWSENEDIVGGYTKDKNGEARLDSILYFPLRVAVAKTISEGSATKNITTILNNRYTKNKYANPSKVVTFIDNHDIERWGKTMKGNDALIKAAYGLLWTIEGIPQIYYGSEQGFDDECRAGMFAGSFLAEGTKQTSDKFDTNHEYYKFFQNLNAMRKNNKVFTNNRITILADTADSAGLFAYVVCGRNEAGAEIESGVGRQAIFVMNTSPNQKIVDISHAKLKAGDKFELLSNVSATSGASVLPTDFVVNSATVTKGKINFVMPGSSYGIFLLSEEDVAIPPSEHSITLNTVPTAKISGSEAQISGIASKTGKCKIVFNDDFSTATEIDVTANTEFNHTANVGGLSNGKIKVQLVLVESGEITAYSNTKTFTIERPFVKISEVTDPTGDDNGVGACKGTLALPTEPGFKGQFDIEGVEVYRSGNDIRLGLKMKAISKTWNPNANLFDHVIFHVFVSKADETGCEYHSGYNYTLPSGFKWDYMYQVNGWGSAFYSANGATKDRPGTAVTPSPTNSPSVDWDNLATAVEGYSALDWSGYSVAINTEFVDKPGMIWITIPASSIGFPADVSGYKFYVNTYDFDMGAPRGIVQGAPEQWKFGTGSVPLTEAPRVVDETDNIIVIP